MRKKPQANNSSANCELDHTHPPIPQRISAWASRLPESYPMLDPLKQAKWFAEFLTAAKRFPHSHPTEAHAKAWAKSMSLIVEQIIDDTDTHPPEAVLHWK